MGGRRSNKQVGPENRKNPGKTVAWVLSGIQSKAPRLTRTQRTRQTVVEIQRLLHAHVGVWDLVQHKQVDSVVQLQEPEL